MGEEGFNVLRAKALLEAVEGQATEFGFNEVCGEDESVLNKSETMDRKAHLVGLA